MDFLGVVEHVHVELIEVLNCLLELLSQLGLSMRLIKLHDVQNLFNQFQGWVCLVEVLHLVRDLLNTRK